MTRVAIEIIRTGHSALVCLRAGDRMGVGEATPLPGYSTDDVEQAGAALAALSEPPRLDAGDVYGWLGRLGRLASPAAQCAIETAAFDLAGKLRDQPVRALLCPRERFAAVPVNALISDLAGADLALERGITTLKLKLGRQPFARELAMLHDVRARAGAGVHVRADVNRGWSPEQAPGHLTALAELELEYVEEPVPSAALPQLDSPLPLAADESLAELAASRVLDNPAVRVLVLKPMLLGGLVRCIELATVARAAGAEVVVSHMMDGPIALAACAELALALGPRLACGLAPHRGLERWPAIAIPQLAASAIEPADVVGLGCSKVEALWS